MKKSLFVWIIIIILGVSILSEAKSLFLTAAPLYEYAMNIVTIVLYAVLLVKLLKLQKDAIKWVHIAFIWTGLGMIYNIFTLQDQGSAGVILVTNIVFWAIFIVVWVSLIKHLRKTLSPTNQA